MSTRAWKLHADYENVCSQRISPPVSPDAHAAMTAWLPCTCNTLCAQSASVVLCLCKPRIVPRTCPTNTAVDTLVKFCTQVTCWGIRLCRPVTVVERRYKQSSMRMRARLGKCWPRRAAPRSGCSLVLAKIRMLDCCSHMSFHLWPLWSTARCHDNGLYHFSTAHCHGNGPDCTILHAILRSKCIRNVTEHVGTRV